MNFLEPFQLTALPALLFLIWLPLFLRLKNRHALPFFAATSAVMIMLIHGPAAGGALLLAVIAAYGLIERLARLGRGRRVAIVLALSALHAAYWACFHLPRPGVFDALREADRGGVFVLFSGVALSFFRLISYFWDRLRGDVRPLRLHEYLAYVLYFPQFLHGPIERPGAFVRRLHAAPQNWNPRHLAHGLARIGLGLAGLAALVAAIFAAARLQLLPPDPGGEGRLLLGHPERLTVGQLLLLIHAPALMLYAVESSYARLQLGVSRVFAVNGSENYRYPLAAPNPRELWQRWNVTLSNWLRDYAYKPFRRLGVGRYLAVPLTFVYSGLLHGLQLRFLAWGVWAGGTLAIYLAITDAWRRRQSQPPKPPHKRFVRALLRTLAALATFHWLCIGVTIVIDPHYCGLRVFGRYLQLLFGWLA